MSIVASSPPVSKDSLPIPVGPGSHFLPDPATSSLSELLSLLELGVAPQDIGRYAALRKVDVGTVIRAVQAVQSSVRQAVLAGYKEAQEAVSVGLIVADGHFRVTTDFLRHEEAGSFVVAALDDITQTGKWDLGAKSITKLCRALAAQGLPLTWFIDEAIERGAAGEEALSYILGLLTMWDPRPLMTDEGNARRLVTLFGDDLKFVPEVGWMVWDGRRWAKDRVAVVNYMAKQVAGTWARDGELIARAARLIEDEEDRQELMKLVKAMMTWARRCGSATAIKNMVKLAESEPGVPVNADQLDSDPYLLNVLNGTLDLNADTLRVHDRSDLITKLAPVPYRRDAQFDVWDQFLLTAAGGDAGLVAYLQRAAGYSIAGDVSEEIFIFVHGPGGSGKSTLLQSLNFTLGDYAMTADFESFVKQGSGRIRNDIARLKGARLVASIEVEEGKELAQGLVKSVTGGDTVSARFLYKEFFEFKPDFKLWLVANDAPGVDADDDAMWRRMRVIPLVNVVPVVERRKEVKALLTEPALAGAAILNWLVDGFMAWRASGLGTTEAVVEATAQYREAMDVVGVFLEERCVLDPAVSATASDLFQAYQEWAIENGEFPIFTNQAFGRRLAKKGFANFKSGQRRWRGLRPKMGWERTNNPPELSTIRALPSGR